MNTIEPQTPSSTDAHEERRDILHKITQETRYTIIQSILMHPQQLPSLHEIDYANPDKSTSTIREHLDRLIEDNIVEVIRLPDEEAKRDLPRKFFGLTTEGRDILEEAGLLEMERSLQYAYENTQKTSKVKRYEEAPRPN